MEQGAWSAFLLLRREGSVWGVVHDEVTGLERHRSERRRWRYRVALREGAVMADELLGVVEALVVRPAPAVVRRFWNEPLVGLAVHDGLPVVLVDPARPPRALRAEAPDGSEA